MPYVQLNPQLASKIGVNKACLLQEIARQIENKRSMGATISDGKEWAAISVSHFFEQILFMSRGAISNNLNKMIAEELIETSSFGEQNSRLGITRWFAITSKGWQILRETEIKDSPETVQILSETVQELNSKISELTKTVQILAKTVQELNTFSDENPKTVQKMPETVREMNSLPEPPIFGQEREREERKERSKEKKEEKEKEFIYPPNPPNGSGRGIEPLEKPKKTRGKPLTDFSPFVSDGRLLSALNEYAAYRKENKWAITPTMAPKIVKNLEKKGQGDVNKQIAIIEESMANGWRGLFALKENQNGQFEAGTSKFAPRAKNHNYAARFDTDEQREEFLKLWNA